MWTGTLEVAPRAEVCELLKEVGWGWVGVAPEGEFGLGFSPCLHMGDRKEGTNSCPLLSLGHGEPLARIPLPCFYLYILNPQIYIDAI